MNSRTGLFVLLIVAATTITSAQTPPQNMIFGQTAYDSGWVDVTQPLMAFDNNTMSGMMYYDHLIESKQVPFYLYLFESLFRGVVTC